MTKKIYLNYEGMPCEVLLAAEQKVPFSATLHIHPNQSKPISPIDAMMQGEIISKRKYAELLNQLR